MFLFIFVMRQSIEIERLKRKDLVLTGKRRMKVKCHHYWKVNEINSLRAAQLEELYPHIFLKLSASWVWRCSLSLSDGHRREIRSRMRFTKTAFIPSLLLDGSHLFQVGGCFQISSHEKAKFNSGSASEAKGLPRIRMPTRRDNKYMQSVTREFSLFSARTWCEPKWDAPPQQSGLFLLSQKGLKKAEGGCCPH